MNTIGGMSKPSPLHTTSHLVRLDGRRRLNLPSALLEEASIMAGSQELIAYVDGPGRVVLEDPTALLGALQNSVAAHKRERHIRGSLVDRLLKDRRDDKSLR